MALVIAQTSAKQAHSMCHLSTSDVIRHFKDQDQDFNFTTKTKPTVQDQDFASQDQDFCDVYYRPTEKRFFNFRP